MEDELKALEAAKKSLDEAKKGSDDAAIGAAQKIFDAAQSKVNTLKEKADSSSKIEALEASIKELKKESADLKKRNEEITGSFDKERSTFEQERTAFGAQKTKHDETLQAVVKSKLSGLSESARKAIESIEGTEAQWNQVQIFESAGVGKADAQVPGVSNQTSGGSMGGNDGPMTFKQIKAKANKGAYSQ